MLKSGGSILDANPGSDLDAIQHLLVPFQSLLKITKLQQLQYVFSYLSGQPVTRLLGRTLSGRSTRPLNAMGRDRVRSTLPRPRDRTACG